MRILVCGCRDWTNPGMIMKVLQAQGDGHTLIEGGAKGADTQARAAARVLGWDVETYEAEWERLSSMAGPIRNQQMLDEGKPDLVIAFWDGSSAGTLNMIRKAVRAAKSVTIFPAVEVSL